MTLLCARLSRWALWEDTNGQASLTLQTGEHHSAVTHPTVEADLARSIKPAWRRRLDLFGRAAAETLDKVLLPATDEQTDNPHIVFCSQHGNINRTVKLLHQVATNDALSPADFSMSVHNAFVGVASINWAITQSHTAIAAGHDSVIAGLTETLCQVMATQSPVILCYVDLPLPDVYAKQVGGPEVGTAFAARFEPQSSDKKGLAFSSHPSGGAAKDANSAQAANTSAYDHVKLLTNFLAAETEKQVTLSGACTAWTVSRHD